MNDVPGVVAKTTDGTNETTRKEFKEAKAPRKTYEPYRVPLIAKDDADLIKITNMGKEVAKMLKELHITVCQMKIASWQATAAKVVAQRVKVQEQHAQAYDLQLEVLQHEEPFTRARKLFEMLEQLWEVKMRLSRSLAGAQLT